MGKVRALRIFALLFVVSSTAAASSLAINLPPLIGGLPTLYGYAGEAIQVFATITPDVPLILGSGDVSVNSSSDPAGDTSVLLDPSNNFYPAEPLSFPTIDPGTVPISAPTTGAILTVSFPLDVTLGLTHLTFTLNYGDYAGTFTDTFTALFNVETEAPPAPEPAYAIPVGLILLLAVCWHRRQSARPACSGDIRSN